MRKRIIRKSLAAIVAMTMLFSTVMIANAEEPTRTEYDSERVLSTAGMVGNSVEYSYTNVEGDQCSVVVEDVTGLTRASGRVWRVYFNSGVVNCEFYMNVTNNKVTSVYDYHILCVGCTFSNAVLSKTTTQGKLDFDVSALYGIANFHAWLKGTVTGSNNDINVTWNF